MSVPACAGDVRHHPDTIPAQERGNEGAEARHQRGRVYEVRAHDDVGRGEVGRGEARPVQPADVDRRMILTFLVVVLKVSRWAVGPVEQVGSAGARELKIIKKNV